MSAKAVVKLTVHCAVVTYVTLLTLREAVTEGVDVTVKCTQAFKAAAPAPAAVVCIDASGKLTPVLTRPCAIFTP